MSWNEIIIHYELTIRLVFFFGIFAAMALWEVLAPRRVLSVSKSQRWLSNISIVFLNSLILRLIFPAASVGMALFVQEYHWGIFNYYSVPFVIEVIICVLAMDCAIYLQHVMVHAIPVLWRLHRVHHADLDFDVTTGSRFHPLEIIFSMLIKFAVIAVLGPPLVAVLIFEVLLNGSSMFNHSNVRLPPAADRILRSILVTPDMHRVHHSVEDDETNSNFGFNLSLWDRLFGTYKDQPRAGHEHMSIGIRTFRDTRQCSVLPSMLMLPFIGKVTDYAINRRSWQKDKES